MAKQQKLQKYCFKLHTSYLAKNNWNLTLPLKEARKSANAIVTVNDSQVLRWIEELNGTQDVDAKAKEIREQINILKAKGNNKKQVAALYDKLYELQFQKDYLLLVIDKKSDYNRANNGFTVNGVQYHRLLGTAGGIKTSTIVYVSNRIYPEIKKRIDNGRDMTKPMVAAKLEAYQALACSGSIPVSWPKGIIIVPDCMTTFTADVISIDDNDPSIEEPKMEFIQNKIIENDASDGCGMMLPTLSKRWNGELGGNPEEIVSGINSRCAWTKGMVYTFDFIEFAEKIAHSYIIKDAWGHERDVRDAELILTTSMLKLWDSYESFEAYYQNCLLNHYQFSVAKTTPHEMDKRRNLNYQFIQGYQLSDEQIQDLISPTVDEIKDIMGLDYRKSILYLCGANLNEKNIAKVDPTSQALMVCPEMINDPFIRNKIKKMIAKRIRQAKIGVLTVEGNFAIMCGDLYALSQSMFGLEITGLLNAGELYHKFWKDKNTQEVACFRAPMTSHNNVVKQKISYSEDAAYWFRYIENAVIINAWDTLCMSCNGADLDGDLLFTTNNKVLVENHRKLPPINCVQKQSSKIVPTEQDIINSNKGGFGDKIGSTTNLTTSQISLQASFAPDSAEYKELEYRILCGQQYQQNAIDKIKGIVSRDMPKTWYVKAANRINTDDSAEIIAKKEFYNRICSNKKPYFFMYNYSNLKTEYDNYMNSKDTDAYLKFGKSLEELKNAPILTENEQDFMEIFYKFVPLDTSPSTINRICWAIEDEFDGNKPLKFVDFDHSVLKSCVEYSKKDYDAVFKIYKEFNNIMKDFSKNNYNGEENFADRCAILIWFKEQCDTLCLSEETLCDIIVDICYSSNKSKQFAWDMCGDQMVKNLLKSKNNTLFYPTKDENGDFEFKGELYSMKYMQVGGENDEELRV